MNAATQTDTGPSAADGVVDTPLDTIIITPSAAKVMRAQLDKRGTPQGAIRFGIRGGGCTGFSYMFQFEDGAPRDSDTVAEAAFDVRVYVDPKSMRLIKGTRIHFETGLRGHGFRFDNPQTSDSCGCGESISF